MRALDCSQMRGDDGRVPGHLLAASILKNHSPRMSARAPSRGGNSLDSTKVRAINCEGLEEVRWLLKSLDASRTLVGGQGRESAEALQHHHLLSQGVIGNTAWAGHKHDRGDERRTGDECRDDLQARHCFRVSYFRRGCQPLRLNTFSSVDSNWYGCW